MLPNTELNSHFKSGYFAYGPHCVLLFSTSIWNNLLGAHQVFKLQKRVVSVMSGVGRRSLFRKLNILPTARQYILSLMLFILDNQTDFLTWFRHQKQKSFVFTCCNFILCSKRSFILWGQNL
jgi:hypothetical protein